jgi:hypothetical protein
MLVGTCPFKGVNETDLLFNIRSQSLKIPGSIEVSKGSIGILSRLLERTSTRRASIEQLLQITRKLMNDQSITATVATATIRPVEEGSSVPMKRSSMENTTEGESITNTRVNSLERRPSAGDGRMSALLTPEQAMRSSKTGGTDREREPRTPQQQQQQYSSSSPFASTPPPPAPLGPGSSPSSNMKYFPVAGGAGADNSRQRSASQQYTHTPPSSSSASPSVTGRNSKYPGMSPPAGLPMESPLSSRQQQAAADHYYNTAAGGGSSKSRSRSVGDPNYGTNSPFFPGFLEENYQNNHRDHNHSHYANPRSFSNETERSPLFTEFGKKPSPRHSSSSSSRPTSLHHYSSSPYEQQKHNFPAREVSSGEEDGFVVIEQNPNAATAVYNNNSTPKMSGIGQQLNNKSSPPIPIPTTTTASTTPSSSYQDHPPMKPSSFGKASSNPAAAIWDFTKQTFEKTLSSSFGTAMNSTMPTVTPSSSLNSRDSNGNSVGFQFQQQDQPNDTELTESLLFQNLLQRCETYCDTINVITNLADQIVMQEQLKQGEGSHDSNVNNNGENNNNRNSSSQSSGETTTTKEEAASQGPITPLHPSTMSAPIPIVSPAAASAQRKTSSSATSFNSPSAFNPSTDMNPNESPSNTSVNSQNSASRNMNPNTGSLNNNPLVPPPPSKLSREATVDVSALNAQGNESMDNYLAACSLYFHAMTILKNLINSLTYTREQSEPFFQSSSILLNMKNVSFLFIFLYSCILFL